MPHLGNIALSLLIVSALMTHCLGDGLEDSSDEILSERASRLTAHLQILAKNLKSLSTSAEYTNYYAVRTLQINLVGIAPVYRQAAGLLTQMRKTFTSSNATEEINALMEEMRRIIFAVDYLLQKSSAEVKGDNMEIRSSFYSEFYRVIESLHVDWEYSIVAKNQKKKEQYISFFMKQYEHNYKHATLSLFNRAIEWLRAESERLHEPKAIVPGDCNGLKIHGLCSSLLNTVMKGLAVEGGYFANMGLAHIIEKEENMWRERLQLISNKCNAIVEQCRAKWRNYALPVFNTTYDQMSKKSNSDLGAAIYRALTNTWGQRAWFVFVYDAVTGFDYHAYIAQRNSLFETVITRWRENNKMVSVASIDLDEHPLFISQRSWIKRLKLVRSQVETCVISAPADTSLGLAHDLRKMATADQPNLYRGTVTYVVRRNTHLHFFGTPGRYVSTTVEFPKNCTVGAGLTFSIYALG